MTYQQKLKDPRWQKKRLEILERDNWCCQVCFSEESTLHVHHKKYNKSDPWDIDNFYLITLCEECHQQETVSRKVELEKLNVFFIKHCSCRDLNAICDFLELIITDDDGYASILPELYLLAKYFKNSKRRN